ncbi:MAG: glycoside hydrolase family 43 protein [Eubacterium sp.]|nr:glycoside hydrolase family 43 protein [Eubacterium sp.]
MKSIFSAIFAIYLMLVTFFGQYIDVPKRAYEQIDKNAAESITLPLPGGSDPWLFEYENRYYYCYSVGNGVGVRSSDKISTLCNGEETIVYRAPEGKNYSYSYWAPELHHIGKYWYIYVAADNGNNENHRMYVLKGERPDGQFKMVGKICDETNRWAIDGTVLEMDGELYFIWSGWETEVDTGQNLYIAHMSSPTKIDGERRLISSPTRAWERNGHPINEGPEILKNDGKTYIIYSASGSWTDDYCLGMLVFREGDVTDKDSWVKCPNPVFKKTETAYGPGHCSFLKSKDGKVNYIAYHSNLISGTGWDGRTIRIQPFIFKNDIPVFGKPLKENSEVNIY